MAREQRALDPGAAVRGRAARQVAAVVGGEHSLSAAYARWQQDQGRDAALLRALVTGTLRWHHRLDWQLGELLRKPLAADEQVLGALLRVGLFQLQWLRIPDHAAVSATVGAAAAIGRRHARGLVNAVMRGFLRRQDELAQAMTMHPVAWYAHPQWLIDAIRQDWGDRADTVLAAGNTAAPMWLRVNRRRCSVAACVSQLAEQGIAAERVAGLPDAILLPDPVAVSELPGYAAGDLSVQDGAAQRAAALLGAKAGERVLDACAAPGGKAAHILELTPGLAGLTALDQDPRRLARVGDELGRLGLAATLVAADAGQPAAWWDGLAYDRILLDAPCSATGVIRRHPDIKLRRQPEDVVRAGAEQARLLAALWPLLKPGGTLLYATCSALSAENNGQIRRFIAATPEIRLISEHLTAPGEANMDGFYYACLKRM